MLDFNHRPAFHEQVTDVIDAVLDAERAEQTPRDYLGASRLGVSCERQLQYEYAGAPVDDGRECTTRKLAAVSLASRSLAVGSRVTLTALLPPHLKRST